MASEVVQFLYILAFSIIGGVVALRFKQPTVLGVLLAGALIGPNAFGLIDNEEILSIAIEIGAILLLFLVGIEFSVQKLISFGIRSVLVATIKLGLVFLLGYYTATLFGFTGIAALAIGVILSITSTVIFLKILEQKGLNKSPEVALLIAVLIIEDIFGVFALTFFSSLGGDASVTPLDIVSNLFISLAIITFVYIGLSRIARPLINWLSSDSSDDIITFMAIGLCAGMSFFAHEIGLSTAVGAFLAGNIVSSLKRAEHFEKAINPFIVTFTAFFFFSIGTIVDIAAVQAALGLVIALLIVNVAMKFFGISIGTYIFSPTNAKGAVFSGLAMVSLGEFSLLIAKEVNALNIGVDVVSITATIIFFSSIIMSFVVPQADRVHAGIVKVVPSPLKKTINTAHNYFQCFSLGTVFSKFAIRRVSLEWHSIFNNLLGLLFVTFLLSAWYQITEFQYIIALLGGAKYGQAAAIVTIIVVVLFLVFRILKNFRDLVTDVFRSFVKMYPDELPNERKIFLNLTAGIVLFMVAILVPGTVSLLELDQRFTIISAVALVLVVFPVLTLGRVLSVIVRRNKKLVQQYSKEAQKDQTIA